jgi:hypothetical protein
MAMKVEVCKYEIRKNVFQGLVIGKMYFYLNSHFECDKLECLSSTQTFFLNWCANIMAMM